MRTTIDLPDDLFRALKARAALNGVPLRELVRQFVESGLRQPSLPPASPAPGHRQPPPVVIPPTGKPIPALSPADLRRIEEEEDVSKHA